MRTEVENKFGAQSLRIVVEITRSLNSNFSLLFRAVKHCRYYSSSTS